MAILPGVLRAQMVLKDSRYFSLGTVDSEGPWVAVLAYVLGPPNCIYFFSERWSRHGRAILDGGSVAGVMYDSRCRPADAESFQFAGTCEVVDDRATLFDVLKLTAKRDGKPAPDDETLRSMLQRSAVLFRVSVNAGFVLDQTLFAMEKIDGREAVSVEEVFEGLCQ